MKWNATDIEQRFDKFKSRYIKANAGWAAFNPMKNLHRVHFAINLTSPKRIYYNMQKHSSDLEGKIFIPFYILPVINHNINFAPQPSSS